jgi:hypothetical protein
MSKERDHVQVFLQAIRKKKLKLEGKYFFVFAFLCVKTTD